MITRTPPSCAVPGRPGHRKGNPSQCRSTVNSGEGWEGLRYPLSMAIISTVIESPVWSCARPDKPGSQVREAEGNSDCGARYECERRFALRLDPSLKPREADTRPPSVRWVQVRARVLHRRTLARLGSRSGLWADLHRTAASKVVYANPPDHPEMLVWRRTLRPGDLFVDVGANVGSYAIWAGDLGAEVVALEPAEDTFSLLMENVALNGYPVRAIKAAAGATCGVARFTTGRDSVNRLDREAVPRP